MARTSHIDFLAQPLLVGPLSSTLVQFLDSSRLGFLLVSVTKAMFAMPGRGVVKGETLVELLGDEFPVIVLAVRLEVEVAVEGSCFTEESGPIKERMTGKRTRPWKRPKRTVRTNTLKKVRKTWE